LSKFWHVPFCTRKGTGHEGEERGKKLGRRLCGMFLFAAKREHAIRKLEGGTRGAKDGEERDKILLRDVHFHIF